MTRANMVRNGYRQQPNGNWAKLVTFKRKDGGVDRAYLVRNSQGDLINNLHGGTKPESVWADDHNNK